MANNKYTRRQKYISTDGGLTFNPVTPPEYIKGELIETDSVDCGAEVITWVPVEDAYICENAYGSPDVFREGTLLNRTSKTNSSFTRTVGVNEDTGEIYLVALEGGETSSNTPNLLTADFNGNLKLNGSMDGMKYPRYNDYFVKNKIIASSASSNWIYWKHIGEDEWHTSNRLYIGSISQYAFGKFICISGNRISKVSMSFDDIPTTTINQTIEVNQPSGYEDWEIINFSANTYNLTTKTFTYIAVLEKDNSTPRRCYLLTLNTDSLTYVWSMETEYESDYGGPLLYYYNTENYGYNFEKIYNLNNNTISYHGYMTYPQTSYDYSISPVLYEIYGKTYLWSEDDPENYQYITLPDEGNLQVSVPNWHTDEEAFRSLFGIDAFDVCYEGVETNRYKYRFGQTYITSSPTIAGIYHNCLAVGKNNEEVLHFNDANRDKMYPNIYYNKGVYQIIIGYPSNLTPSRSNLVYRIGYVSSLFDGVHYINYRTGTGVVLSRFCEPSQITVSNGLTETGIYNISWSGKTYSGSFTIDLNRLAYNDFITNETFRTKY